MMNNPDIDWYTVFWGAIFLVPVAMGVYLFVILIEAISFLERRRLRRQRQSMVGDTSSLRSATVAGQNLEIQEIQEALPATKRQPSRKLPRGAGRKKKG